VVLMHASGSSKTSNAHGNARDFRVSRTRRGKWVLADLKDKIWAPAIENAASIRELHGAHEAAAGMEQSHVTIVQGTAVHCTARHCTALHCTAMHCISLYCTVLNCGVLSRTIYCIVLYCTVG